MILTRIVVFTIHRLHVGNAARYFVPQPNVATRLLLGLPYLVCTFQSSSTNRILKSESNFHRIPKVHYAVAGRTFSSRCWPGGYWLRVHAMNFRKNVCYALHWRIITFPIMTYGRRENAAVRLMLCFVCGGERGRSFALKISQKSNHSRANDAAAYILLIQILDSQS